MTLLQEDTKNAVERLLADLGESPDEVAATLLAGGYKGNHAGAECPLARYLAAHFGEGEMWVERYRVCRRFGSAFSVELPEPVAGFLQRFDFEKGYPELEIEVLTS